MSDKGVHIILGQGIAGSTLAWQLHWEGNPVRIIDRGEPVSASRIAAGLITPITGRRFTKAADFDQAQAFAEQFYRRVEQTVNQPLLDRSPTERIFIDHEEKEYFLKERAESLRDEVELICDSDEEIAGFRMLKAARLRVLDYLRVTRDYFSSRGEYFQADVRVQSDILVKEGGVRLQKLRMEGERLFFCQGYQQEENPWFPAIPDAPSRGEILKVRIRGRADQRVIHRRHWIAPASPSGPDKDNQEYLIGATYDRENLTAGVTDQGRAELEKTLREITTEEAEIVEHQVAVRAGTKQRRAVFRIHQEYPQLAILNGLGSRASLWAPVAASQLIELLSSIMSGKKETTGKSRSLTKLAHTIVRRAIRGGDTVIDATAGNGNDTLFLALSVGASGQVIAIDLQAAALQSTQASMEANGIQGVQLLQADHGETLSRLAGESMQVKAVMFNLGYLPGGEKDRTTSPRSTVQAIKAGLRLLSAGGVMTVIAYRGHPGGKEETHAVEEVARQQEATVMSVDIIPGSEDNNESPVLFVFRRTVG
jgi:glycine/D-amino acid oxidase-like deaminating enzyme